MRRAGESAAAVVGARGGAGEALLGGVGRVVDGRGRGRGVLVRGRALRGPLGRRHRHPSQTGVAGIGCRVGQTRL